MRILYKDSVLLGYSMRIGFYRLQSAFTLAQGFPGKSRSCGVLAWKHHTHTPHILIAPHGPGNLIAFQYRYKITVCGGQMDDDIFPPQLPVEYIRVYKLPDSLL